MYRSSFEDVEDEESPLDKELREARARQAHALKVARRWAKIALIVSMVNLVIQVGRVVYLFW